MAKHNVWMSVSDLMTGLMVIFLFIAVAYMSKVDENQTVLKDFVETKHQLHDKLVNEFKGDTAKWKMSIDGDDVRINSLFLSYVPVSKKS